MSVLDWKRCSRSIPVRIRSTFPVALYLNRPGFGAYRFEAEAFRSGEYWYSVPAGQYRVRPSSDALFSTAEILASVSVESGAESTLTLPSEAMPACVSVTVLDLAGNPTRDYLATVYTARARQIVDGWLEDDVAFKFPCPVGRTAVLLMNRAWEVIDRAEFDIGAAGEQKSLLLRFRREGPSGRVR